MRNMILFASVIVAAAATTQIGCASKGATVDPKFHQLAEQAAQDKLTEVVDVLKSEGIKAAAEGCKINFEEGAGSPHHLWITCGIVANFVNPKTYHEVTTGNTTLLPVGVYLRAENADVLLKEGWQPRDITIVAKAFAVDPAENSNGEPIAEKLDNIPSL